MRRAVMETLPAAALALLLSTPPAASSYEVTGIGGQVGVVDRENMRGTTSVDLHMELEDSGSKLHLLPSVGYWKKDVVSDKNVNFDMFYHFLKDGEVSPYLGAGAGMHFLDVEDSERLDDNQLGVNLFGGVRFPGPAADVFFEGRYVAMDRAQTLVRGGVTFHIR